ncbi:MAG: UvrB/UvrC motif-containing protein [Candidatus Omnitrophota bacterium]
MLCQICRKNEATVEFTKIINDKMTKLYLCDKCAKEKDIEMEQNFSIADFLAGMADLGAKPEPGAISIKCPKCKMSFDDFRKKGRLGCGDCYAAFKQNLLPLLKRIHGSARHTGKMVAKAGEPYSETRRSRAQELRQKLQRAVDTESFEEAAKIRDEIRELEKKAKRRDESK